MSLPLKPGYNFNYERKRREFHYEMSSSESYTDYYGISITDRPYERILIKFTDKMVSNFINTIGQDSFNKLFEDMIFHFTEESQEKLLQIFDEMAKEWEQYDAHSELILEGLLNKLIITALRERIIGKQHSFLLSKLQQSLIDAIRYIENNFANNPSLEETADYVNVSPSYLSKLFTKHTKTSYSQFLTSEKINHATKLLANTTLSMPLVAEQSGFSNSNYFCDVFKKTAGVSPLGFRKQIKSN